MPHNDKNIPSASSCWISIPRCVLLIHSGDFRNEFRLNQSPCPSSRSMTGFASPNLRSVNQCCSRFKIKASIVLIKQIN